MESTHGNVQSCPSNEKREFMATEVIDMLSLHVVVVPMLRSQICLDVHAV